MNTESNSAVIKMTSQLAQIYPSGKLDTQSVVASSVANEANILLTKLEKLKSFSGVFANVEISPYVKNLVGVKKELSTETRIDSDSRTLAVG